MVFYFEATNIHVRGCKIVSPIQVVVRTSQCPARTPAKSDDGLQLNFVRVQPCVRLIAFTMWANLDNLIRFQVCQAIIFYTAYLYLDGRAPPIAVALVSQNMHHYQERFPTLNVVR